ncbi:uncharacterized protein PHALS_11670 [Plasmopara halstedii]|uniref:RxLR-like protein n=1 Tax=Plasmopara halstedii TaxID=4781 RepID=A0A0P1AJ22_PLAHL|nr:uncharacterized protein PHALS_11670 [Plasmopara halstedii]CEG41316.1 hypothetical protein PHALS_11670 [Plasmopara halstedii]|eukprot:XP_024577685.1 hypothetical protein PHALS_11670 [Plasmopara halstedii]
MGRRTFGVVLLTLCVMTSVFVSASDMATNSSANATASKNETVAQLLKNVQSAVADNPALANMFDIPNANEMSEEELTTLLQELLDVGVSVDSSGSTSTSNESAEEATSASAADTLPSSATVHTVPAISAAIVIAATLAAIL